MIVKSLNSHTVQFGALYLTGRPCTRQTKAKMAKSWILAKLGWVDQLIGGVDHTKYFCPEVTLIGVRAHPIFELTKKN